MISMLPTHGPFLLTHVGRTNSSHLIAHDMPGGTGSFHSTHTPESPCARRGLQVSEPLPPATLSSVPLRLEPESYASWALASRSLG